EALRGSRTVRIDLRHHHALAPGAGDVTGGLEREAEPRHLRAGAFAIVWRGPRRLALLARQFAQGHGERLLGTLADDIQLDVRSGWQARDLLGEIARI